MSPTTGPTSGSTAITITSSRFEQNDITYCKFGLGGTEIKATWLSHTAISCVTEVTTATSDSDFDATIGAKSIFLSVNAGNDYIDSGHTFSRYKDMVATTNNNSANTNKNHYGPSSGGTPVTISGRNFQDVEFFKCRFTSNNIDYVVTPSHISIASDDGDESDDALNTVDTLDTVVCNSPTTSTASSIYQTTATISISLNNKDFTLTPHIFNYFLPPVVSNVYPATGPIHGNSMVSVYGENFAKHTNTEIFCKFGDNEVAASFVSSNLITCVSPPSTDLLSRAVALSVSTNSGINYSQDASSFKYSNPIVVNSIFPLSGPETGSTSVSVFGEGEWSEVEWSGVQPGKY